MSAHFNLVSTRVFFLFFLMPFFFVGQSQVNPTPAAVQKVKVDSLQNIYSGAKNDSDKISYLIYLIRAYYDRHDLTHAQLYNNQLRVVSERVKASKDRRLVFAGQRGKAFYYLFSGDVQKKQSKYQLALKNYFLSLDLFTAIGNRQQCAILFSNIATLYSEIGNYSESLAYSFKALKSQEDMKNETKVAVELNNIGAIYSDIKRYSKALPYFIKARNISQKQNDKEGMALYTGNIGHGYQMLCDSAFAAGNLKLSLQLQDKALSYYFKSIKMSEEVADNENIAVCLENIAILYYNINNYKHALPYLLRALEIYKDQQLIGEQSYCLTMAGAAYQGLGNYKKAEECLRHALFLAQQIHSNYYLMEANLGNSAFYEAVNQPSKALEYYKDYIAYRDSIFNLANTNAIARAELNYEFEKKQAASKFENDKVVYQLESDNKLYKQWRFFFIAMIIFILGILFFVKRGYDTKKKLAAFLSTEDKRKDLQLREVHHRINNSLQFISSLLTLQANHAKNEKLTEYLIQSQHRIQSLSALHELLYDKNVPLNVNMKDYARKVLGFHRDLSESPNNTIHFIEKIDPVELPGKLAMPLILIINELVTNSIKYAFKGKQNGFIKVELFKDAAENCWCLQVSDNGTGFPVETAKREGGIGLKLVDIMTKQIGGNLILKTEDGVLFTIVFKFSPEASH